MRRTFLLLGIATMRAGIPPRWAGLLFIIGAVLFLVNIPLNGTLSAIVSAVAFVLFGLAAGWVGYVLMAGPGAEQVQPAAAAS